jgi:hypothetical protein
MRTKNKMKDSEAKSKEWWEVVKRKLQRIWKRIMRYKLEAYQKRIHLW